MIAAIGAPRMESSRTIPNRRTFEGEVRSPGVSRMASATAAIIAHSVIRVAVAEPR